MSRDESATVNVMKNNSWFLMNKQSAEVKTRLFCFPYAGGSAAVYRDWARFLPGSIQVVPVELPGRGTRLNQPAFSGLSPLIEALAGQIPPLLDLPFSIFGHSMGATIGFEIARRLRDDHGAEPRRLFVSARRAPRVPRDREPTFDLPHDEFVSKLHRLNGTPSEVLDNAELMELMMPTLRSDFRLVDTYSYQPGRLLECPITAIGGLEDSEVTREKLAPWKEETNGEFSIHMMAGDHFFLRTARAGLLPLVARLAG